MLRHAEESQSWMMKPAWWLFHPCPTAQTVPCIWRPATHKNIISNECNKVHGIIVVEGLWQEMQMYRKLRDCLCTAQ